MAVVVLRKTEVKTPTGIVRLDIKYDDVTLVVESVEVLCRERDDRGDMSEKPDDRSRYVVQVAAESRDRRGEDTKDIPITGLMMKQARNFKGNLGIVPDFKVKISTSHGDFETREPGAPSNTVNNAQGTSGTGTSLTLSAYAVGSESDRMLVCHASGVEDGNDFTWTSCVFNGSETMTSAVDRTDTVNTFRLRCAIFELQNPTNATADIVLTPSREVDGLGLQAVYLSGAAQETSEAQNSDEDTESPHEVNIPSGITTDADVIYGGQAVANDVNITDLTESGCTERSDVQIDAGLQDRAGMFSETATGPSETGGFTHDGTGGTGGATLVAASFAPVAAGGLSIPVAMNSYRQRHQSVA